MTYHLAPILELVLVVLAFGIYLRFVLIPLINGAPFVPTNARNLSQLIDFLRSEFGLNNLKKAVDLGSGDGRIVTELARAGIKCDGIEQNKLLCLLSQQKINKAGLQDSCKIYHTDFFRMNLSDYDLVILFQTPYIMNRLGNKIKSELKPGALVVSHCFKIDKLGEEKIFKDWYIYKT